MASFYGYAGDVRAFLARTQVLSGTIWHSGIGERLRLGRGLIEALSRALPEEGERSVLDKKPDLWNPAECAAVLEYFSCLDANHCHCANGEAVCGYDGVCDHLRDSMLSIGELDGDMTYRQQREKALSLAEQLQKLLEHLVSRPEHIEGSPPGEALGYLEDVIAMLTPDDGDTTSNGSDNPAHSARRPALRLAVDNTREVRP